MREFLRRRAAAIVSMGLLLASLLVPAPVQAAVCSPTYGTDGRPTIAPTGAGPGSGKRIGFDNTHGQTAGQADWVIDGGFSDMACALADLGYSVEEIRAYPLSVGTLALYDAVVIPEPNIPFTTAEHGAMEAYVNAGGSLLLVADHYQADRNYNTWDPTETFNGFRRGHHGVSFSAPAYHYNGVQSTSTYHFNDGTDWLASAFGFRFRSNAMDLANVAVGFGPGDPSDPEDPGILPPALTYGITAGVGTVKTYAGATISIVDPTRAMGVVYPNMGTLKRWNNAQSNDPVALYTDNVGIPAGGAPTYGGRAEGAYVAIAKVGLGKVAAAGDSSLWEDKSPKYRREVDGSIKTTHDGWKDSDHDTLGLNLVKWLTTPDAAPGIEPALRQPVTPEPYNVYTIGEPLNEPWTTGPASYKWYDSRTFANGAYNGTNTGLPPVGVESWTWDPIPLKAYPNNNLAIFLGVTGLTPNSTLTAEAGVFVISGGTQIGKRYQRSTGTYPSSFGYSAQTHQVGADGAVKRWEFFQLNANTTTADRAVNARARVGTNNKVTSGLTQTPVSGTYGKLKVEAALGYNDGLHAALFTKNGALDTAVQIQKGSADTDVTLPPGTYTLEIQTDTEVKRTGVSITITASQTLSLAEVLGTGAGDPNAGLSFSSVPQNAYPGNRLALYLDGQSLAQNQAYSTQALLADAGDQSLSRRYDRATQSFGGPAQSLTANSAGETHRWEFFDLDAAPATREISARVSLEGAETDRHSLTQVAGGTYGYLNVESTLGYSNGLHAALFSAGSILDTAVWLANGSDTQIALPPGTYALEIRDDAGAKRSGITVAITEGQTLSLNQILSGNPQPQPGWHLSYVPAHVYPGNKLALLLDAGALVPDKSYSVRGYVYVTGGLQISKRYNPATGLWVDGLTARPMSADGEGALRGWEFWELTDGQREINARLQVDGSTKTTKTLNQINSGNFGTLAIPAHMGYSDGRHAALFYVAGSLDTTAWIASGVTTEVTLPAGTYDVAIHNNAGLVIAYEEVTIEAGKLTSLHVAGDRTPPTIRASRSPAPNEYGWNNQNVTITFECEDAGSGIKSCNEPITVSTEGADQSVIGLAVDNNRQNATITVSGINIDKSAPITTAVTPGGLAGGTVTVTFDAMDNLSGVQATYYRLDDNAVESGSSATFGGDGTHLLWYWSVDRAGNVEAAKRIEIVIDDSDPTIEAERTPANEFGWNNGDVIVTFLCRDEASGIASCTPPVTLTAEGANQSVSGTATDRLGRSASLIVDAIHIDRTAPSLSIQGARRYYLGEQVLITCTAIDVLSGLVYNPCGGPLLNASAESLGVGEHTVSVLAIDRAGNLAEATVTFTVSERQGPGPEPEADLDTLRKLTIEYVTKAGHERSLLNKLDAAEKAEEKGNANAYNAHMNGFINELNGVINAGSITAEHAAILERLARTLLK